MATGYKVYCPSTSFSTYSGKWMGSVTTWAWEFETYVKVRVQFYTTQKQVRSKVQGTDYFYGSAVLGGQTYDFRIAYLGYPGVNSSYTFEQEVKIPFDSSGKAEFSFAVSVQGAAGTYLQGYSLGGSLSHTFTNQAKPGTLELSPSAKKMGDSVTLAVRGGEGTVRYRIAYAFGALTGLIEEKQMIAEDAALYETEWIIPDLLEGCPNATGGMLTLTCETYRFDTLIGTSQVEREISVFPAAIMDPPGEINIGYDAAFAIERPSERYSITLRYRLLGQEGVIGEGILEDAYTWAVPLSLGKAMPATDSETIYIFCDTYHGTALVGSECYSCNAVVHAYNALYKPVIDRLRIRKFVPDAPETFQGLLLQNVSRVDLLVDAHSNCSELAAYRFRGFGTEITLAAEGFSGFLGVPVNGYPGDNSISITVTDRRGGTETNYYTLSVLPYSKPRVIPYSLGEITYAAPICFRSDREGMASGSGSYLRLMAGKLYSEILSGEGNINGAELSYRIRKSGEDWPEEFQELLPFGSEENYVSRNLENAFPDPDASYQVELRVKDLLGFSHSYLVKVSSRKVNFSLLCAADGAAFGKTAEHPGVVEIAQDMTLWVRGGLKVDGAVWQQLEAVESTNIWESGYAHGRRSASGCFYRLEQDSGVSVVFNRAIKWSGSRITVNAEPIPQQNCPPAPVSAICPAENGFVLATVGTDGYITVDLAWNSKSATQYNWIDGFIQYWKEDI